MEVKIWKKRGGKKYGKRKKKNETSVERVENILKKEAIKKYLEKE